MNRKQWELARLSSRTIRARLLSLRKERPHIQLVEISRAMRGGIEPMLAFCRRHQLSLDWVYFGNLGALLLMAQQPRP